MFVMSIAVCALLLLVWQGFYLEDPRSPDADPPLMQNAATLVVIGLCWLSTFRRKKVREQINYRVLPPDFHVEPPPERKIPEVQEERPARFTEEDNEAQEAFKQYLETL
jgi:hypothetical protein